MTAKPRVAVLLILADAHAAVPRLVLGEITLGAVTDDPIGGLTDCPSVEPVA